MDIETLTKHQRQFFDLIESTPNNYFVSGGPGTGKSVLINALSTHGKKKYHLTAPTGMAAVNINGSTIHSLLGIPSGVIPPSYNKYLSYEAARANIKYNLRSLIIDEISMVRVDTLDFIHRTLCDIKGNVLPFGGVQIIVVGDFFQLPPVVNHYDNLLLQEDGWNHPFAFGHPLFKTFKVLQLKQVLRQSKDKEFMRILEQCRNGNLSQASLRALNRQVKPLKDKCIQLVATNSKCDEINEHNLRKIKKKSTEYSADSYGSWPAFPVETVIELKVGAQILVKRNGADIERGRPRGMGQIVNGTIGTVKSLHPDRVTITTKGKDYTIYRARWERKEREQVNGEWVETVKAAFEQIPLRLAWAISMHKSQGQTFDRVHIDPAKVFTAGQLYVAISRCRSLKGITFEREVELKNFKTNPHVIKYYSKLK